MDVPTDDRIRVGVRELRGNLSELLRQVRQGRTVIVLSHNEVVAEINPPAQAVRPRRQAGTLRGKIHMAPDFDALPPDVLAAMEE